VGAGREEAFRPGVADGYRMERDYALNGPNEDNCHFRLFATPEHTRAWEKGKADAAAGLASDPDGPLFRTGTLAEVKVNFYTSRSVRKLDSLALTQPPFERMKLAKADSGNRRPVKL
jgi:hypothetical protein